MEIDTELLKEKTKLVASLFLGIIPYGALSIFTNVPFSKKIDSQKDLENVVLKKSNHLGINPESIKGVYNSEKSLDMRKKDYRWHLELGKGIQATEANVDFVLYQVKYWSLFNTDNLSKDFYLTFLSNFYAATGKDLLKKKKKN